MIGGEPVHKLAPPSLATGEAIIIVCLLHVVKHNMLILVIRAFLWLPYTPNGDVGEHVLEDTVKEGAGIKFLDALPTQIAEDSPGSDLVIVIGGDIDEGRSALGP